MGGNPVVPGPLVEKPILSPLNSFSILAGNQSSTESNLDLTKWNTWETRDQHQGD